MANHDFKTRLKIAKNKIKSGQTKEKTQQQSSIGTAFKLSTELVSAVAGIVAGISNVIRSAKKMQK